MKVVTKPLSEIKPYWRNARKNDKAVPAVMKSIEEYGYISPIIVDKEGVIIAGHSRYKALSKLGYTEADVVIVDMPTKKAKEYRIIDNKTSELADWDMNLLLPELREFESLEDFTDFFPELSLQEMDHDSIGQEYKPISDDEVRKVESQLNNKFSSPTIPGGNIPNAPLDAGQVTPKSKQNIHTITCPHCAEDIEVVL